MPRHDPSRRVRPNDNGGRWNHERLIAWAAGFSLQHPGGYLFYHPDPKASLQSYLDEHHMMRVYDTMRTLYPLEYEVFAVLYSLDADRTSVDAVTWQRDAVVIPQHTPHHVPAETVTPIEQAKIQQETIGKDLNLSQPTVSRLLESGRYHFRVLYEGRVLPPRHERKTLDKAK